MENFHWTKLFNPEFYITMEIGGIPIGIYMVLFIVFAETGLFAGFFLPGDSLLFLSGIYSRELVETFFYIPSDFSNVTIPSLLIASAARPAPRSIICNAMVRLRPEVITGPTDVPAMGS